eukprot:COSAG06_NODE_36592_length_445_cov_0.797688_2_plen_63_part_01
MADLGDEEVWRLHSADEGPSPESPVRREPLPVSTPEASDGVCPGYEPGTRDACRHCGMPADPA